MFDTEALADSPLSVEDVARIDATGLSNIDRHYLRLLAHCLACFKIMANYASSGPLPQEEDRLGWLSSQSVLMNEKAFIFLLLQQFQSAGEKLEKLAEECNVSPLELTLEQLIKAIGKSFLINALIWSKSKSFCIKDM